MVGEDERETTGRRAVLNYGHTFCHAIESLTGYGQFLHGEAVSIGMLCASTLPPPRPCVALRVSFAFGGRGAQGGVQCVERLRRLSRGMSFPAHVVQVLGSLPAALRPRRPRRFPRRRRRRVGVLG